MKQRKEVLRQLTNALRPTWRLCAGLYLKLSDQIRYPEIIFIGRRRRVRSSDASAKLVELSREVSKEQGAPGEASAAESPLAQNDPT